MNLREWTGQQYRVLLLPGTQRDGKAICELLGKRGIQCEVCGNARETASALASDAGLLLLSDQEVVRGGTHLISDVLATQPDWSDLPVLFLSKQEDESRQISEFVSRMTNVTLLDKPASARTILSAVQTALRSRAKQYMMRDQLVALRAAEAALRESDRRKDEFLAMLAHELRNPLSPIRAAAELLPRQVANADPRILATVEIVRRQSQQLSRLVDDLLDVSRITVGRIKIQRDAVDLSGVIRQALEAVDPLVKSKRHTVSAKFSTSIYVLGDSARLVQCVSNLITNAVKYTEAGGHISVSLTTQAGWAVVTVSDNGIGIPADLMPRIFDLFVQNERALDRSQGGLGIGLSVVRRLIEMQGGEVTASSAGPGEGSTFEIRLPETAAPEVGDAETSEPSVRSLRVLIVDDNEDAADTLGMLFSIDGHEVHTVHVGELALEAAPTFKPDLILLDIGLPGMNGYEVATRLRVSGVGATMVAVTGYGQKDDIDRSVKAGFDAHIAKPVDFAKLEEIMARISRRTG